jgi:hypothetical protein
MTRSDNITTGLAHPFVTRLTKIQDLGATTEMKEKEDVMDVLKKL